MTDEGRSFVRRSREQYDAIISVHTISNAAIASGALALAENYVLTREAFADYLDRLAPDGVLYFTRPETQIARLVATGRASLASGVSPTRPDTFTSTATSPPPQPVGRHQPSLVRGRLSDEEVAVHARRGAPDARAPRHWSPATQTEGQDRVGQGVHCYCTRHSNRTKAASIMRSSPRPIRAQCMLPRRRSSHQRPTIARSSTSTALVGITFATVLDLFTQERLGRLALEDRPVAEVTLLVLLCKPCWSRLRLSCCRWPACARGLRAPPADASCSTSPVSAWALS